MKTLIALVVFCVCLVLGHGQASANDTHPSVSGGVSVTLQRLAVISWTNGNGLTTFGSNNAAQTLSSSQIFDAIVNHGGQGPDFTDTGSKLEWISNYQSNTSVTAVSSNWHDLVGMGLFVQVGARPGKRLIQDSGTTTGAQTVASDPGPGYSNWGPGEEVKYWLSAISIDDAPGTYTTTVTYTLQGA